METQATSCPVSNPSSAAHRSTISPASASPDQSTSYGQILKSSALIGGSSVLNIGFGIIRTKAMAVLLGPGGVALLGLFNSVFDLVRSLAGMGINNSGVRQIAEAVGSADNQRIARTVTTLRRVALGTGILGALLLIAFCRPIARLTFGDEQHAVEVAWLSLAVLFAEISAGQFALVQGMRRIADLARINVIGSFFGTVFTIPLIYYFGAAGIVPSLVIVAAAGILTSWWFARKIRLDAFAHHSTTPALDPSFSPFPRLPLREFLSETSALLRMGLIFMVTGLMAMGVAYVVRIILVHQLDLEAAGFYQAAWVLGGLYFGFILQAMGTDFYPRLTAVARDNAECNRLVNEQAEVGLLLAGPGVLATLSFAPWIIDVFYSPRFGPAVEVLRWISIGMVLRVAAWPMAFVLIAKGNGGLYLWTELAANAIQVGLVWGGVALFGLNGTGMAFCALYIVYGIGICFVVRRVSAFRWSSTNRRLGSIFAPVVLLVFVSWYWLPGWLSALLGCLATLLTGVYSLRLLCTLVSLDRLPPFTRKLGICLRILPRSPAA